MRRPARSGSASSRATEARGRTTRDNVHCPADNALLDIESDVESRRSARAPGRFWVAVEGVDTELVPRRGDISATGIFFESDTDVGDAGTVQWLRVSSWDRSRTLAMMANVVRSVRLADVHREIRGVALEFMPESDEASAKLCDFVRYVLESPRAGEEPAEMAPRVAARAAGVAGATSAVTLKQLSVQTLLLETDWSVPVGESVRVEIIARGKRHPVRVEGQAVSVLPAAGQGAKRYRIAVQIRSELDGPLRRFSSVGIHAVRPEEVKPPPSAGPLDQLLSALIQPPEAPPERHHLAGLLSRIPFPSLCALLELERLSGDLTITRGDRVVRLFVSEGRFVDVEPYSPDPRAELRELLGSREGSFEFTVAEVGRVDRIGATMTQLLLDLARQSDEDSARAT